MLSARALETKIFPLEELKDAARKGLGYCINCGHIHKGIDHGAWGYLCHACGELAVHAPDVIIHKKLYHS